MAERNLIKEGFVFNTLMESGTVSGTQILSIPEINALVDGNFTTAAVTITGSETAVLDADLGARWKLDRVEYYTDETSSSNFQIQISDNNVDFFDLTVTGSAPLYVGDISTTTVSGAPRYLRLEHAPVIDTDIMEWRAINDGTFVDFGSDGTQTQVEITDAPVGTVSASVTQLTLKNNQNASTVGFVFVDPTGNDADDQIEIAANANGPWFGRTTADALQPDNTDWSQGELANARIVPSGVYSAAFIESLGAQGWETDGLSGATVSGSSFIGISTSETPGFFIRSTYGDGPANLAFNSADIDQIKAILRVPTLANLTEGPRLFWIKREDGDDAAAITTKSFSTTLSVAGTPTGNFTGVNQEFTFDVGSHSGWSDIIIGMRIQPYTVSSGIGVPVELGRVDVVHSDGKERIALALRSVVSGTFPIMDDAGATTDGASAVFNSSLEITEHCIITKIKMHAEPPTLPAATGFFLATVTGTAFPSAGDNFLVKRIVRITDDFSEQASALSVYMETDVFWPAAPGDIIGHSSESRNITINYRDTASPSSYTAIAPVVRLDTIANTTTDLDNNTFTVQNRQYVLSFDTISADKYVLQGRYKTPVFDGGSDPALVSSSFQSSVASGTSIDVSGNTAFDTINARASNTPPLSSRNGELLGESTGNYYRINEGVSQLVANDYTINTINSVVTNREFPADPTERIVQNVAGACFYHEQKNELWVLNIVASGTVPNDISPTWDVIDVDTGGYIRTQHVTGAKNYTYDSGVLNDDEIFEGVGFIPDYDREEIYIIQRIPGFFLGTAEHYGIALDLNGNFKNVILREDAITDLPPGNSRFENCIDITYDGTYFYLLTSDGSPADSGERIGIIKWGTTTDVNEAVWVDELTVVGLVGFSSPDPKAIAYNSLDGLYYLLYENITGTVGADNRAPELLTVSLVADANDNFTGNLTTTSGTAHDIAVNVTGFNKEAGAFGEDNWSGITNRVLQYLEDLIYIPSRNTFGVLQTQLAKRSDAFPATSSNLFDQKSHSFFGEIGAGNVTLGFNPGEFPRSTDFLWGSISGTLDFEQIQENSVLFPTGRYAQLEYVLNSTANRDETPFLTESKLVQGLRIGDIAANGTKDIFLRTNIPEDSDLTTKQGRLRVFWEIQE